MSEQVTLEAAMTIIEAARKKAEKIGVPMNVAVVDSGANLVAFARMDGAWLGSVEIARNKAYTARAFDMSTKELGKISQPGDPAYGIADSTNHRIAIFPGGSPEGRWQGRRRRRRQRRQAGPGPAGRRGRRRGVRARRGRGQVRPSPPLRSHFHEHPEGRFHASGLLARHGRRPRRQRPRPEDRGPARRDRARSPPPPSAAPTCTSTTASCRRWRRATSSATSRWAWSWRSAAASRS